VFPGLGHDTFVSGDHKKDQVDPCGTRHHVLYEPLVARNINKAQPKAGRKGEGGEPELNGDAPFFFFLETVGVDAG